MTVILFCRLKNKKRVTSEKRIIDKLKKENVRKGKRASATATHFSPEEDFLIHRSTLFKPNQQLVFLGCTLDTSLIVIFLSESYQKITCRGLGAFFAKCIFMHKRVLNLSKIFPYLGPVVRKPISS